MILQMTRVIPKVKNYLAFDSITRFVLVDLNSMHVDLTFCIVIYRIFINYSSSHSKVPSSMALQNCSRTLKERLGFLPGALDQIGVLGASGLELDRKRCLRSREEELGLIIVKEFSVL